MKDAGRTIYVDTCPFGKGKMRLIGDYAERYRGRIGFEVLAMFDLPDFEAELETELPVLKTCPVCFHGPVFQAEHSAPRGSAEYEETMWHVRKTEKYAKLLNSSHFVMHLNNRSFTEEEKEGMLRNALENYRELKEIFGTFGCKVLVENTGLRSEGSMLLDQREFTELCAKEDFDILVDIGHANANGWDIPGLIRDLKDRIRCYHFHNNDGVHDEHRRLYEGTIDFDAVLEVISRETPEAEWVIEYTRPEQEGDGLRQDIETLISKGSII